MFTQARHSFGVFWCGGLELPPQTLGVIRVGWRNIYNSLSIPMKNIKFILLLTMISYQAYAQTAVYPLNIGDTWQYRYLTFPIMDTTVYSFEAVSDTFINGNRYTVILFCNSQYKNYERQSGDSIFLYKPGFNQEFLYFDFSRSPGDTVSSTPFGSDTIDVILRQSYIGNYFGRSLRSWVFYVNQSRQSIDDEYSVVVTDSLGIMQVIPDFGDPQYLVGAIINGKVFGTIVSVNSNDQETPKKLELY